MYSVNNRFYLVSRGFWSQEGIWWLERNKENVDQFHVNWVKFSSSLLVDFSVLSVCLPHLLCFKAWFLQVVLHERTHIEVFSILWYLKWIKGWETRVWSNWHVCKILVECLLKELGKLRIVVVTGLGFCRGFQENKVCSWRTELKLKWRIGEIGFVINALAMFHSWGLEWGVLV